MASILVAYGTGEGQTAKIAERIVAALQTRGHATDGVDVGARLGGAFDVGDYDAVLVGASIHGGRHQSAVRRFVETHRDALSTRPTGFFQVCLTAASPDEERQAEAAGYVDEFVETTEWRPDRIAIFGGALRYSSYGFLKRALLKRVARDIVGDTDTTEDVEYTDWDEVDRFAADFAAFVEERVRIDATKTKPQEADGD